MKMSWSWQLVADIDLWFSELWQFLSVRTVCASKILDGFYELMIFDILYSLEITPISTWWTLNHCVSFGL
jgi:hypothetical protein